MALLFLLLLVVSLWSPTPGSAQSLVQQASTQSTAPLISASPNPVAAGRELGSTTITWTTGDGSDGLVWVSKAGESEALFARGPSGSAVASWIESGAEYTFHLYSADVARRVLGTIKVLRDAAPGQSGPVPSPSVQPAPGRAAARTGPVLNATPNPVTGGDGPGTTEVSWDLGDGSPGRVMVSVDGGQETLFARGSSGAASAGWIVAGSTYEFRLYGEGTLGVPLTAIIVSRGSDSQLLALAGVVVVVLAVAFFLTLLMRRSEKSAL